LKPSILDFTQDELKSIVKPAFRAKQIYNWIYVQNVDSFSEMKNIPNELKTSLQEDYILNPLEIARVEESLDGSKKYLFRCQDGSCFASYEKRSKE